MSADTLLHFTIAPSRDEVPVLSTHNNDVIEVASKSGMHKTKVLDMFLSNLCHYLRMHSLLGSFLNHWLPSISSTTLPQTPFLLAKVFLLNHFGQQLLLIWLMLMILKKNQPKSFSRTFYPEHCIALVLILGLWFQSWMVLSKHAQVLELNLIHPVLILCLSLWLIMLIHFFPCCLQLMRVRPWQTESRESFIQLLLKEIAVF